MTSPYLPLPPDSDDDDVPMSDNEESNHTRSSEGYPYVPIATDTDTEEEPEEDPEEDTNSWENNTVPTSSVPLFSFEITTPARQTARKRVTMPQRETLSPDHTVPTVDPYQGFTDDSQGWRQALSTLHKWSNTGRNHSTSEQGESSTERQPLLDTTPIIVNRMLKYENRMDLMEDVIMQMPEPEAYGMLEDHLVSAEEDISGVREAVQSLTAKLETTNIKLGNMEDSIDKLIDQSHQCKLMETIFFDMEAHAVKKGKRPMNED